MPPLNPRVSIVVPAYNEARRLPQTIRSLEDFAAANGWVSEVIIVDDGSRDETALLADVQRRTNDRFRLITYTRNAGKGYAIRRGVMEARGEAILISDADLSTPIHQLPKLLEHYGGSDLVIGSRAVDESLVREKQTWYRQRMGKIFNRLMVGITGLPFRDTQCGFKLIEAAAAKKIFREAVVDRFAWDVEILMLACRAGLRVAEVPVEWFNSADSRVRIVRDSTRMLLDTLRLRLRLGKVHCLPAHGGKPERQHAQH
jgi:dolichyl-phosphate beta-glucosyltransferase